MTSPVVEQVCSRYFYELKLKLPVGRGKPVWDTLNRLFDCPHGTIYDVYRMSGPDRTTPLYIFTILQPSCGLTAKT